MEIVIRLIGVKEEPSKNIATWCFLLGCCGDVRLPFPGRPSVREIPLGASHLATYPPCAPRIIEKAVLSWGWRRRNGWRRLSEGFSKNVGTRISRKTNGPCNTSFWRRLGGFKKSMNSTIVRSSPHAHFSKCPTDVWTRWHGKSCSRH